MVSPFSILFLWRHSVVLDLGFSSGTTGFAGRIDTPWPGWKEKFGGRMII
jgi:hypothetical protein